MHSFVRRLAAGAAAGLAATIVMSLEMGVAKSAGLLGEPPPRNLSRRIRSLFGRRPRGARWPAATAAAHLAYGAAAGVAYAALPRRARGPLAGTAFGTAVWAAGYLGWIPKVGPARSTAMVLPHVVYGNALDASLKLLDRGGAKNGLPLDSTADFLREGYAFMTNRFDEIGMDSFETRLGGLPVFCMRGEEAARLFYAGGNFTRIGTTPPNTLRLLQGKGTAPRLDGAAHAKRKRMFMSFMSEASIAELLAEVERQWELAIPEWAAQPKVVLHDAIRPILCRAAAAWIGIPEGEDLDARTEEVAAMVDEAASLGLKGMRALWLRHRTNRWAKSLVDRVRKGTVRVAAERPLAVVANERDENGDLISLTVAANEVINLLRPIVAVSRFIVYAAHALEKNRGSIDLGDKAALHRFAQEVRRFYPFFPAIGGRALVDLQFEGHAIAKGDLVMLDLWGTNHDPKIWPGPLDFRPERFVTTPENDFNLVAQGGGDYFRDHRCPGEPIAIALTELAAKFLTTKLSYSVPVQDLSIDLSKIPALPKSGFVIAVKP